MLIEHDRKRKSLSKKRSHNPTQITPRLQKMIDYLTDGLWHTTGAIARATNDNCETKTKHLLVGFGYHIETRYKGMTKNKRRITERRMLAF